jgi:hypothetical protein
MGGRELLRRWWWSVGPELVFDQMAAPVPQIMDVCLWDEIFCYEHPAIIHLQLVSRSRKRESIHPLPVHLHGVVLSELTFLLYQFCLYIAPFKISYSIATIYLELDEMLFRRRMISFLYFTNF